MEDFKGIDLSWEYSTTKVWDYNGIITAALFGTCRRLGKISVMGPSVFFFPPRSLSHGGQREE
jgi:hypothetical protein